MVARSAQPGDSALMKMYQPQRLATVWLQPGFSHVLQLRSEPHSHDCLYAPDVARALVPRSVTAALALPIAEGLGAHSSVTAAAVVCTGAPPDRDCIETHCASADSACARLCSSFWVGSVG